MSTMRSTSGIPFRDLVVAALGGLLSTHAWLIFWALLGAYVWSPLLFEHWPLMDGDPAGTMDLYGTVFDCSVAVIAALLLTTPISYFLRSGRVLMWGVFAVSVFAAAAVPPASKHPPLATLLFFFNQWMFWAFLGGSAVGFWLGGRLRRRRPG